MFSVVFRLSRVCFCITGVSSSSELAPRSLQTPMPSAESSSQDGVRYFSVMWCKASKKKHKRWEGDAVLVTRGRTVTLKDMEGKDIGKGEAFWSDSYILTLTLNKVLLFVYILTLVILCICSLCSMQAAAIRCLSWHLFLRGRP